MNQKLLEQLGLAKEAGSNAMAKDFFAKTPGTGGEDVGKDAPGPGVQADAPGTEMGAQPKADGDQMTPQMLEELLQLLAGHGQGK